MTAPRPVTADPRCAAAGRDLAAVLREAPPAIATATGAEVRPLRIGIHEELAGLRRDGVAAAEVQWWLRRYCRATSYVLALSRDGSRRHGLDGGPVEAVSDAHRAHARRARQRAIERGQAAKPATAAAGAAPEPAPRAARHPAEIVATRPPPPRPAARLPPEEAERRLLAARAARASTLRLGPR